MAGRSVARRQNAPHTTDSKCTTLIGDDRAEQFIIVVTFFTGSWNNNIYQTASME